MTKLASKDRWMADDCLEESWNKRTAFMATLISKPCTVVEFGAGAEHLRQHLPAGSRYVPIDIKRRSPRTVVLDLDYVEKDALPKGKIAFFSGVIEYISDFHSFTEKLTKYPIIISSYCPANYALNNIKRTSDGWKNHFTISEFISTFEHAGFILLEMRKFGNQRIFHFKNISKSKPADDTVSTASLAADA